jgi:hypothetical protein
MKRVDDSEAIAVSKIIKVWKRPRLAVGLAEAYFKDHERLQKTTRKHSGLRPPGLRPHPAPRELVAGRRNCGRINLSGALDVACAQRFLKALGAQVYGQGI